VTTPRLRARLRKRITKIATRLAVRRGEITEEQATEALAKLEEFDWESFLEWLVENLPAILELIMQLLALF
jgi:hypothetical protein